MFASVCASYDGGRLTTAPMRSAGDELVLNLKADYGQVLVECLDLQGETIPGFNLQDCVPLEVDSVEAPVRWKEKENIRALRKAPFKLRFHLRNARLYSYCCA